MTRTVVTAIRADLIRPTPAWLAEVNFRKGALVNALARSRDPEGFRRLRAACSADAAVSALAAGRVVYRTALIVAAKGGTVSDVTTGDVLEVLDAADDKLTQITASLRRTADAVQLGMPAFPDIAGRSSSDKPVVKDAP
jgi:hypothetical protein